MLTQRQQAILNAVVQYYVHYHEPVGSRTLSKMKGFSLSPATLRNEMVDLTEMGYIEQPHTSAGRRPTQKGYRYYVDHLMQPVPLSAAEVAQIHEVLRQANEEETELVRQAARLLATITHHVAVALGPTAQSQRLQSLQLIPLREQRAVVLLVSDTGHVQNHTVQLPDDIAVDDLVTLVGRVGDVLRGSMLDELPEKVEQVLRGYFWDLEWQRGWGEKLRNFMEAAVVQDADAIPLTLEGTRYVLAQPDGLSPERAAQLLAFLEEQEGVIALFRPSAKDLLRVSIGQENGLEPVQEMSVVTATFAIGQQPVGTVGVIGPLWMDYARVVSILELLAPGLSVTLERHFGDRRGA